MNTREKPAFRMPTSDAMTVVTTTKATAASAPLRRLRAKARTLFGLPLGRKLSPGSISRQMPVKLSSKVSADTA